jgi:hypothetical protein
MSVTYLRALLFKSGIIQQEIEREQSRRWPDSLRLLKLKKLRLVIKDRLARLSNARMARRNARKRRPLNPSTI